MGMVLGRITVETPKYTVAAKGTDYEIREYEPWLIAETSYDPAQVKEGKAFMTLANFIGALGNPKNVKSTGGKEGEAEKIAMTAPVLTQEAEAEKIAMTAPVVTQQKGGLITMQFILPSNYNLQNVPKPTDEAVAIREVPSRKFGVITFSGSASEQLVEKKRERLREALQQAGYTVTGDSIVARYNPPFTLSFLKTNEVLLPVA